MSEPQHPRPSSAVTRTTPKAEVDITVSLVRRLVQSQHPDLADLGVVPFESGWDNEMFRLGDRFLVRLPRRKQAVACIASEQTWLATLAPRLSLPVPAPVRLGEPEFDYPWRWSVLPWLDGQAADQAPVASGLDQELVWARFLGELHQPAPPEAPDNWTRGVPLKRRADTVDERLDRLVRSHPWLEQRIVRCWRRAVETEIDVEPTWIHGDLHQRNVLVQDGRFAAVIDWGDLTAGDRANDLASIWMQFPSVASRREAQEHLPDVSPATWLRAQGWAIFFATLLLDTGLTDSPRHAAMGEAIFRRLDEDLDRGGPQPTNL